MGEPEWTHQNKEWQETLDLARKYGWTSKLQSNHGGKLLQCPVGEHKIPVYSTGKSAENVARSARKTIARCQHGDLRDPLDVVATLLEHVGSLIHAAGFLMDKSDALEAISDILDNADEQMVNAEAEFDKACETVDLADKALGGMKIPGLDTSTGSQLLDDAQKPLRTAGLELRGLPSAHDQVHALKLLHGFLKTRYDQLRARLESTSSSSG